MDAVVAAAPRSASPLPPRWRGAHAARVAVARTATDADPELLLLARCAAEIAREAGAGAELDAIAAPRQALLLRAAIDAVAGVEDERGREIVYVPRSAVALLDDDELLALLRMVGARHGGDALLVVAVECAPPAGRSAATTRALGVPSLERFARAAGWQTCQLWSDGCARHALVVFERAPLAVRAS